MKKIVSLLFIFLFFLFGLSSLKGFSSVDDSKPDNYLSYSLIYSKPIIWNKEKIKVFIKNGNADSAKKMFAIWQNALNNKLTFIFTDNSNDYDILVETVDKFVNKTSESTYVAGQNIMLFKNKKIFKSTIQMLDKDPITLEPFTEEMYNIYLLHEIGHALGLSHHSPYPEDIMYFATSGKLALSERDINSINLLYSGIQNVEMAETVDYKVYVNEGYTKFLPDSGESYVGLGNVYRFNGDYKTAIKYYKKAIEIEPERLHSYYPMCLSYVGLKNNRKAYNCFEHLVKNQPDNLYYIHAFSNISAKTNRKDLARKYFEDYINSHESYDKSIADEIIKKLYD